MVIKRPSIKPQPNLVLDLSKTIYVAILLIFLIFLTKQTSSNNCETIQI